jgi:peptidoglycan/LPS O-acetylase OafA/YrhL
MQMSGKQKNGKIELLRFVFAFIIVLHHSRYLNDGKMFMFNRGSLGVEFFFLVSGYLMAMKCADRTPPENLGEETWSFIFKKYKGLLPDLWIAQGIAFVMNIWLKPLKSASDFGIRVFGGIFEVLGLSFTGFNPYPINGVIWYISAMLIAMMILFPLCRKNFSFFSHCLAPLFGFMLIGMLQMAFHTPTGPDTVVLLSIRKGLIRALGEICLGVVVFELSRFIQKKTVNLSTRGAILFSIMEFGMYALILHLLYVVTKTKYDTMILYLMLVALTLSCSQRGLFSHLFDNKLFYMLGRISLPLYLCHSNGHRVVNKLFPSQSLNQKIFLYLVFAALFTLVQYALSLLIKKWYTARRCTA